MSARILRIVDRYDRERIARIQQQCCRESREEAQTEHCAALRQASIETQEQLRREGIVPGELEWIAPEPQNRFSDNLMVMIGVAIFLGWLFVDYFGDLLH